jgi:spectinomycin phosphotransferase
VREPPLDVDNDDLLRVVRREWDPDVTRLEHAPVGFGAHHWTAYRRDEPVLFVTLDRLTRKRSGEDLEAAYAGAVALRLAGLEFVVAPLLSASGSPVVRFGDGALSCTVWKRGRSGGALDLAWTSQALRRLHGVPPPEGIPTWRPLVPPGFAADMELRVLQPWGPGPYADPARSAVRERLADLAGWTARYHQLATQAQGRAWVVTHGEPHSDNQLLTPRGRYLVDWESLKLAPAEMDLRVLVDAGEVSVDADPEMVEMFDLEWRLDEIDQYAGWFAAEHSGSDDDRIAFDDLLDELARD